MPAVNDVGKPCAGEPHARIDGRELETGHGSGHGGGEERPTGNRTVTAAPRLPPILATAPAPDPPSDVLGDLLSASGAGGGDTEAAWRWDENAWGAHRSPTGWRKRWWPRRLEAKVEPIFHADSYGYRPGRSALDAVAACRQRCWKTDWVIDLDIQKFFDSVDRGTSSSRRWRPTPTCRGWCCMCKRWLHAPVQLPDGTLQQRDRGTPQGSAVVAGAGEPVPALRVRHVDGPGVPDRAVRTLRR